MFIGKFYHTLEENGRISLPKPFREHASEWVVSRGLDGGLFVFTKEAFALEVATLASKTFTKKKHRDYIRLMTNEAHEVSLDPQGRLQLPEYLTTHAGLTKAVVIVGSLNRVEIWDREKYHSYIDQVEDTVEAIAEDLENAE